MKNIGYIRITSIEDNLEMQINALKEYGCEYIYIDDNTGLISEKIELKKLIAKASPGDTIICYSLSKISRSIIDFCILVNKLRELQLNLYSIKDDFDIFHNGEKSLDDFGRIYQEILSNNISEMTKIGLKAARARGVKLGRPHGYKDDTKDKIKRVSELYEKGLPITEISSQLNIPRTTLYRYLKYLGLR